MESGRLRHRGYLFGSYCLSAGAVRRTLLVTLAATVMHAQSSGSITTRPLALDGKAVIDAQQNVYAFGGSGCNGIFAPSCPPMSVAKVNAAGTTVYNFVNSQNGANPIDLAVDSAGEVYLLFGFLPGGRSVAKLSADGSKFLYTVQLPANLATAQAIGLDAQGNSYVAGATQDNHPFVTKVSADGSQLLYTVTLPGSGTSAVNPDTATALAVDAAGDVVVTGQTSSRDFPVTAGVAQPALAGPTNAFVTKVDPAGNIVFSTFLGGPFGSYGQAIRLDSAGNIYTAGITAPYFPTTAGTYQPAPVIPLWSGGPVGYLAKLKPDGSAVDWATYSVSNGRVPTLEYAVPAPMWLALSAAGDVYLATQVLGPGFLPTPSAPQPCASGSMDVVLLHFNGQGGLVDSTYLGNGTWSPIGLALPGDGSVMVAAVAVDAVTSNNVPVLAQVLFGAAGWSAAACMSPMVVNAASFLGGISPGELVSLTGFGIGPEAGVVYQPGPQGQVPTSLGGVTVSFNGIPAPLLYVQSRQVNAQVPFEVSTSTTSVTNVAVTLTYNNQTFGPYNTSASWMGAPGIFRLQPGVSNQAAALNQDGSVNGPSNPAARGSTVTVFGTGYGPLVPSCATGGLNPAAAVPLYFTGTPVTFPVSYEGSAPTLLCGIDQFNFQAPLSVNAGSLLLTPYINPGYGSTIFVK